MTFEEYQRFAKETASYPMFKNIVGGKVLYPVLGLSGEVGEIVEIIKKVHRDKSGELTPEVVLRLRDELGDVIWYISALATELELDLDDIAQNNITKLFSRKERGMLYGDGDNRQVNSIREIMLHEYLYVESVKNNAIIPDFLSETASQSLSRVLSHTKSEKGFGIVTTFRREVDTNTNFALLGKAEMIAKGAGFGFFKVRGYWQEETIGGEKNLVEEVSLFIPNYGGTDLLGVLKSVARLSSPLQSGFIYSDGKMLSLWEEQGGSYVPTILFNKISVTTIENLLKRLKSKELEGGSAVKRGKGTGVAFFFESFWKRPGSMFGAIAFGKRGYIY